MPINKLAAAMPEPLADTDTVRRPSLIRIGGDAEAAREWAPSPPSPRIPVPTARFDGRLRLVDASPEFCLLMKSPLASLVGRHFNALCTVHRSVTQAGSSARYRMEFDHAEVVLRDSCNGSLDAHLTSVWMRSTDGALKSVHAFVTGCLSAPSQSGERAVAAADGATGLPGGGSVHQALRQAIGTGGPPLYLLLVRLDDADAGGEPWERDSRGLALIEAAERIQRIVGNAGGTVERRRIDEFVVLFHGTEAQLPALVHAVLDVMGEGIMAGDNELYLTAAIGACRYPDDGHDAGPLLAAAEAALRHAKKQGGNAFTLYSSQIGKAARFRLELERSLRKAVGRGELELEYQPRVDVKTRQVVALEALVRWNHPIHGRIAPLEFIPLAEEKGVISEIGKWVLETACRKAGELAAVLSRPLRISVNVSARQLQDKSFCNDVREVLDMTRLPPHLLELELTESVLVDDYERCAALLRELKALGLSLSVDDFGTGYSSLAYLQLFPFDIVKLDKTFVNNKNTSVDNRKLVRALIDLSHALDLAVVAEGVECADTLDFLAGCHCDEVQGYLLSPPLSASALALLFAGGSGRFEGRHWV